MGRIAAIDYGRARIGLALSDPFKMIASPFKVLSGKQPLKNLLAEIIKELKEYQIESIIVGLPLLLSGKDSEMTKEVRHFAEQLKQIADCPVHLFDERLSSKQIEKSMIEGNLKRKKRTQHLDTLSATLLLQTYLETTRQIYDTN